VSISSAGTAVGVATVVVTGYVYGEEWTTSGVETNTWSDISAGDNTWTTQSVDVNTWSDAAIDSNAWTQQTTGNNAWQLQG
jgi:hypothetical protein